MALPSNLLPDEASPEWLNKGDNAWQLTAATLVGLQSIPEFVILYGSLVKKTWAVNSAFMAFYAFAMVLLCWVAWGFRMSFGEKLVFFLGKPGVALDENFLLEKAFLGMFPNATMVLFQGVFAGITLILIAGALLGRMNIRSWMLFVPLWVSLSYSVTAFSIWCPDGWLAKLGVIDFAGGYVIHLSAGVAGFTAAYWVGPRPEKEREMFPANNMILVLAGAGLLWMGWSGFNGGAPFAASTVASLAVLNTHVCAAASIVMWVLLDTFYIGKPTVFGAVQGMITGLVCITPAAGVVQGWAAILMGLISGSVPWYTMMILHNKVPFLKQIDDPMAVFHTHAIAGALGGILTGFFAVPKLCRLFYMVPDWEKYIGLAYGLQNGATHAGLKQMGIQFVAIVFVICFNFVSTTLICLLVRCMVPLRLNDSDDELQGDKAMHGEEAFNLHDGGDDHHAVKFDKVKHNKVYDTPEFSFINDSSRSSSVFVNLQMV